jgi:hypothetical protein
MVTEASQGYLKMFQNTPTDGACPAPQRPEVSCASSLTQSLHRQSPLVGDPKEGNGAGGVVEAVGGKGWWGLFLPGDMVYSYRRGYLWKLVALPILALS